MKLRYGGEKGEKVVYVDGDPVKPDLVLTSSRGDWIVVELEKGDAAACEAHLCRVTRLVRRARQSTPCALVTGSFDIPSARSDACIAKRRDPPWQGQRGLPNLRLPQRTSLCGGSQDFRVMSPLLQPAELLAPRRPEPAYALARGPHRSRCRGEPTPTREWQGRDAGTPPPRSPRMRGSRPGGARSA